MRLIEFSYRNILSYGNKLQTFTFDDEPGLILVEGENGAGKSSIKEALTVSIYGRSAIRKMKDIPNWINRHAYTNVKFVTNSGEIIELDRGIDPNFSDIKINGSQFNLPDKRKVDEFIEEELARIPFSVFCNTISLSFDDFKSFVNLSKDDKRKIVDRIFGIDILSDMRAKVKEQLRDNKSEIDIISATVRSSQTNLDSYREQFEALKEKLTRKKEELTDKLILDISNKKEEVASALTIKTDLKEKITAQSKLDKSVQDELTKIKSDIRDLNTKLSIYAKNQCPHCLNDLKSGSSVEIKAKIEERIEKLGSLLSEKKIVAESLNKEATNFLLSQSEADSDYFNKKAELSSLEASLAAAQENDGSEEMSSISEIIVSLEEQIKEENLNLSRLTDTRSTYLSLDDLLSDSGIKKDMIDKIIPTLNSRILEISEKLEFKFSFEFDSEFDPHITYLGMQISPESLSSGQRKKMNLIVLLAFIEIIKMKHNHMNVMFLDEIFSSLDKANVYRAIAILKEYSTKYNMTIFVVSHESLPEEFFDQRIFVDSVNHFSEVTVSKIGKTVTL
jgi:DNA repair exonuclease SbcCD ATPase subunit